MPRPGPRRPIVGLRLGDDVAARVDAEAHAQGLLRSGGKPNRSEMLRVLVDEALAARARRVKRSARS